MISDLTAVSKQHQQPQLQQQEQVQRQLQFYMHSGIIVAVRDRQEALLSLCPPVADQQMWMLPFEWM